MPAPEAHNPTKSCETPFGLLGRSLGHSWSAHIHRQLGSFPYSLIELEPEDIEGFVRNAPWRGLNVTIPFKRNAADLADEKSARVERLGVANTLVRRDDGTIFAENTDVLGFAWQLATFCRRHLDADAEEVLSGRKALVLGSGGASQAVQAALAEAGASVQVISRGSDDDYSSITQRHADAVLLVNTTPVGMFPNCPGTPLPQGTLEGLGSLIGVIEVIYNPCRTQLLMDAEALGIPCEGGLRMLVAQARRSAELFLGSDIEDELVEKIVCDLANQMTNIALIGMPGVGKTGSGRRLARLLGRPFVDIDDAFSIEVGMSPAAYITTFGETAFREIETKVLADNAKRSGLVIACGGGVVTVPQNYALLHQNSTIVMLERPLEDLTVARRPLSQQHGIEALAKVRMPLYRAWADHTLTCTGTPEGDALAMKEMLGF